MHTSYFTMASKKTRALNFLRKIYFLPRSKFKNIVMKPKEWKKGTTDIAELVP